MSPNSPIGKQKLILEVLKSRPQTENMEYGNDVVLGNRQKLLGISGTTHRKTCLKKGLVIGTRK